MRLRRSKALSLLAVGAVLAAIVALAVWSPERDRLWGDEGTYVAMTASLVRDGDLVFGEEDRRWALDRQTGLPATVILQQTPRGITYSKPILYPWLSIPLYSLLGEKGIEVTNLLVLAVALLIAWIYLKRLGSTERSFWTLATFACGSVLLVYVGWKMSDLALFSLTLMGLLTAMGGRRLQIEGRKVTMPFGKLGAAIVGGLFLGAAVSMRYTAAALAAAAVAALLVERRWRRGLVVAVMAITSFLVISSGTVVLTGTSNPYKAVRSSFNEETGYPAGESTVRARERFTSRPATQSATWRPSVDVRRTAYSSLYFLIGRHTGLLFYFPVALVLLFHILRRPDRVSWMLLAGLAAVVGFYLIWMPQNYFGGSTFVGNRYFLGALPVLPVALRRLPSARSLAVAWILALLAWGSAVGSVAATRELDESSQAHVHAGIFPLLPYESTAQRIDGQTERFWAEDYVRFLDPFAKPAAWSFRLDSQRPTTEILVATDWPGTPLEFVVAPKTADVRLEISDGRERTRFSMPQMPSSTPGLLQVPTGPTWRRHAFWWNAGKLYNVRVLRFVLSSASGADVTAVVRYAGRGRELAALAAELLEPSAASQVGAAAGSETDLVVKVRNTGRRPWKREGLFPVSLGYRLLAVPGGEEVARSAVPLPNNVRPGEALELPVTIRWPAEADTYRLVLEILRRPPVQLGELGRLTLMTLDVEVDAAVSPDSPGP